MPAASRRLFVGLILPSEVAERLSRQVHPTLLDEHGQAPRGLRVYPGQDLHLTLAFLGDFPEVDRARLQSSLREEVRGLNAPELSLSGTGAFPGRAHPRVLWAGVEEQPEVAGRLAALRNRVCQAALGLGWRPPAGERERPFRPHVTLARVRPEAGTIHRAFHELSFDHPWLPTEVALLESRPQRPDQRYQVLWAVPLVVRPG